MKTKIKNKQSYRTKIGHPNTFRVWESDPVNQETDNQPTASTSTSACGGDDEANKEDNGAFSNSDEDGDKDSAKGSNIDMEEECASSANPAGMKRKAMGSVEKGKQQKV
jgi:hypothetical protein